MIKSLRTSIQSPVFLRRINGWLTLFWIAMIPVSYWRGWLSSVTYVSALSLWALVASHWSGWQSARVEVKQEKDADVQDVVDILSGDGSHDLPQSHADDLMDG